ncbi:MAG: alanine--tRNA ligase [bacterium]|nr:alanine--tRNA ligase [bacterium]
MTNEPKTWTTAELRQLYLKFFESKNHAIIPGAPVVTKEGSNTLFTTAGMQPLEPFLLGQSHPQGQRLANVQVCIRTTDIDSVGDDSHLTCFEMLGNWSLGDYFKDDSIAMSWEFLTSSDWLGLDPSRLAVTCYAGDDTVPQDTESAQAWLKLGVPAARIFFYGRDDNWWGPVGQTGPCGPDTEIFYWVGDGNPTGEPATNESWLEIWNNVFMQFDQRDDGTYEPLTQQNVDTGMGLERTVAVLNGYANIYEIDILAQIIQTLPAGVEDSRRIITDHIRTAVFMAAAGLAPSNLDRGYVMRRLIRRAIRHGRKLGINEPFINKVAAAVIESLAETYGEVKSQEAIILTILTAEEQKFGKTLERGLREFDKAALALSDNKKELDGAVAFKLYDTYGFPLEITQELADERGLIVDVNGFNEAFKSHQEKSRTATAGTFASGLADHSEQVIKYHTTTHLLHEALRRILGDTVQQKGSNITPERLRLDFAYGAKLTDEQKQEVEELVNEHITKSLPVTREEMSPDSAHKAGALGFFGEKYGDRVSVYTVGDFSKEICTGPHVANTSELGHFKIAKEESVAAGIRRIKAVLV